MHADKASIKLNTSGCSHETSITLEHKFTLERVLRDKYVLNATQKGLSFYISVFSFTHACH
jgi:hypothetical protein